MSTPIEQNTTDLQNILNAVNELPEAGGGGLSSTASALLVTILKNAVYTSNQSANITALEAALASGGSGGGNTGGGDEGGSGDNTGGDTSETVEEVMNPVLFENPDDSTKSFPSINTFEYEVLEGDAATLYKSAVLFEAPEVTGGTLVLDFDGTRISGFRFMVWLLNADGTAYKILVGQKENGDEMGINDTAIGDISYTMRDPGSNSIWTYAGGEVRFAIPDGKKPIVSCLTNGSYTTILDESLMIGGSTTKMYGVINAVLAGEVITAKVVKEV